MIATLLRGFEIRSIFFYEFVLLSFLIFRICLVTCRWLSQRIRDLRESLGFWNFLRLRKSTVLILVPTRYTSLFSSLSFFFINRLQQEIERVQTLRVLPKLLQIHGQFHVEMWEIHLLIPPDHNLHNYTKIDQPHPINPSQLLLSSKYFSLSSSS